MDIYLQLNCGICGLLYGMQTCNYRRNNSNPIVWIGLKYAYGWSCTDKTNIFFFHIYGNNHFSGRSRFINLMLFDCCLILFVDFDNNGKKTLSLFYSVYVLNMNSVVIELNEGHNYIIPTSQCKKKSSLLLWKDVSATLQSGRYTLSYPRV